MLIEYKLYGQERIFRTLNIESKFSLLEITRMSKELSKYYENDLSKSSILIQSVKDIFAADVFSDHDDFFQKIIIYLLTINDLQSKHYNLETIFVTEDSSKIVGFLNDSFSFEVLQKKQCVESLNDKKNFIKSRNSIKRKLGILKTVFQKIKLSLNRRINLLGSLFSLSAGSQILLHHSDRFDDLVFDLDLLGFGVIETVDYKPNSTNSKEFSVIALTALFTLISMFLACLLIPFVKYIKYPKLAQRFILDNSLTITNIFKRIEVSIFFVTSFMFFFKIKNISKIFVYSHLDSLSRCFTRCAMLINRDINYIRKNFLYFTTELHCMSYCRFYVRSDQEVAIAQTIGLSGVEALENTMNYSGLTVANNFKILYINESNGIDTIDPQLRVGIYDDLVKLTNSLEVKITIRPHPTDIVNPSNYPSPLQVDVAKQLQNSVDSNAIIIGRNSTLLLKLAHLGKNVIVYDPSCSLWFSNQSKLGLIGEIHFISDYAELEHQLKNYKLKFQNV